MGKNAIVLAEDRGPLDDRMAPHRRAITEPDAFADDRVGPDRNAVAELRAGRDHGRGMDRDAAHGRSTSTESRSASAQRLPSTVAVARHLQTRNLRDTIVRLDPELVAGHDGPAEAAPVDAREVEELLLPVRRDPEEAHARDLGHRLEDQNPGHHRVAGKVSLEELLVERDVLDAHDPLARLELEDPVHEQERIAVRQCLENFGDPEFHGHLPLPILANAASSAARRSKTASSLPTRAARFRNSR